MNKLSELVLYKNNQLIAFNKAPTLPVQRDSTADKALIDLAEIYCQSKLHLIHRIDRPASGIVLFAKTKNALVHLNRQFQNREVKKSYLAVVKNKPAKIEAQLSHHLQKNSRLNRSFITEQPTNKSKEAILNYSLLDSIDNYHLLKIELRTGRHHQIRAQLAAIDCPIKGDVKYGFRRSNPNRSIHLHAWQLSFHHPVNQSPVTLSAPLPSDPVWDAFAEKIKALVE